MTKFNRNIYSPWTSGQRSHSRSLSRASRNLERSWCQRKDIQKFKTKRVIDTNNFCLLANSLHHYRNINIFHPLFSMELAFYFMFKEQLPSPELT